MTKRKSLPKHLNKSMNQCNIVLRTLLAVRCHWVARVLLLQNVLYSEDCNPYERSKACIIKNIRTSNKQRFRRLFMGAKLRDHKPSQLSRYMRTLARWTTVS